MNWVSKILQKQVKRNMLDENVSEQLQREDPIAITKEQWMIILEDPDLITEKDIKLLKLILQ